MGGGDPNTSAITDYLPVCTLGSRTETEKVGFEPDTLKWEVDASSSILTAISKVHLYSQHLAHMGQLSSARRYQLGVL